MARLVAVRVLTDEAGDVGLVAACRLARRPQTARRACARTRPAPPMQRASARRRPAARRSCTATRSPRCSGLLTSAGSNGANQWPSTRARMKPVDGSNRCLPALRAAEEPRRIGGPADLRGDHARCTSRRTRTRASATRSRCVVRTVDEAAPLVRAEAEAILVGAVRSSPRAPGRDRSRRCPSRSRRRSPARRGTRSSCRSRWPASSHTGSRPPSWYCRSNVRTKSAVRARSMSVSSGCSARNVSQSENTE